MAGARLRAAAKHSDGPARHSGGSPPDAPGDEYRRQARSEPHVRDEKLPETPFTGVPRTARPLLAILLPDRDLPGSVLLSDTVMLSSGMSAVGSAGAGAADLLAGRSCDE